MKWNETTAEAYCSDYLQTSDELTRQCRDEHGASTFTEAEFGCVEDIQVSQTERPVGIVPRCTSLLSQK